MIARLVGCLAFVACSVLWNPVSALGQGSAGVAPNRGEVALESSFFTRDFDGPGRVTALSFVADGRYRIGDSLELGARIGTFGAIVGETPEEGGWLPTNPYIEGRYVFSLGRAYELSVGLGVSVPVIQWLNRPSEAAQDATPPVHGFWNIWQWSEDYLGVVVPIGFQSTQGRLAIGIDADLAIGIPTRSEAVFDAVAQFRARLGYQILPKLLELGAGVQTVFAFRADDKFLPGALVYGRSDFGRAFVDLEFFMNLERFVPRERRLWNLRLGVGVRF